jgi:hypothetical protein
MKDQALNNIEAKRNTAEQLQYYDGLARFAESAGDTPLGKAQSFALYAPRQIITQFIERYEIYKLVRDKPGSILECGVGSGQGLMAFAHFCSVFEPYHYVRRIVGFDTFEGFVGITDKDRTSAAAHMTPGGLKFESLERLRDAVRLYDLNRALGHIAKVDLVKGDISKTLPQYLAQHPHLVIGLLYLDLDLYQPTRDTLHAVIDRVPRGGVICFDELNHADYPGETIAVMETLGLKNLRLRRFPFSANMCYAVVGE